MMRAMTTVVPPAMPAMSPGVNGEEGDVRMSCSSGRPLGGVKGAAGDGVCVWVAVVDGDAGSGDCVKAGAVSDSTVVAAVAAVSADANVDEGIDRAVSEGSSVLGGG